MDYVAQTKFVNLSDDELKEAVGALHEYAKRLSEGLKEDADIQELERELKELKETKYGADLKATKRRLTAARKVASLRGIKFKMPKIDEGDDE